MQAHFFGLCAGLDALLRGDEVYLASWRGEDSDFVRFNHGLIRQSMHVKQGYFSLRLCQGKRHSVAETTMSGDTETDRARVRELLDELRARLPLVPEDPYLLYNEVPSDSTRVSEASPTPAPVVIDEILSAGKGLDLVGILAIGGIVRGFASSFGHRNWFRSFSHDFGWSLYRESDRAVRSSYADFAWNSDLFREKMAAAREQLGHLATPSRTIDPGSYRAYLSPVALDEILGTLAWGGFGLKDLRTRQSPLVRLSDGLEHLHPGVSLWENAQDGSGPGFGDDGFLKPPKVPLIEHGLYAGSLISPRSAQEYGLENNGAGEEELPESLDMAGGSLARENVLEALGTGLYVNNLWYTNFSDRAAGRITGMTRYATFWVEHGRIVAPVRAMRFDESIYRLLGNRLLALTAERDLLLDSSTYEQRSTASTRLPGVLVEDFVLTL